MGVTRLLIISSKAAAPPHTLIPISALILPKLLTANQLTTIGNNRVRRFIMLTANLKIRFIYDIQKSFFSDSA